MQAGSHEPGPRDSRQSILFIGIRPQPAAARERLRGSGAPHGEQTENGGREGGEHHKKHRGQRSQFDQVTRSYGDHSPLTRPKEEVTHGGRGR